MCENNYTYILWIFFCSYQVVPIFFSTIHFFLRCSGMWILRLGINQLLISEFFAEWQPRRFRNPRLNSTRYRSWVYVSPIRRSYTNNVLLNRFVGCCQQDEFPCIWLTKLDRGEASSRWQCSWSLAYKIMQYFVIRFFLSESVDTFTFCYH